MDRTRSQHTDDADAPLDMSRLRRVALWGTAAAAMLSVAVLVGMSDAGRQRMSFAVASWSKQDRTETRLASAPTPSPPPIIIQRDLEAMGEARRLAESVRTLAADRDRLQTRLSTLERTFEDVTGSIKREISAVRPTPPNPLPPIDLPSMAEKPAPPATTVATAPATPAPATSQAPAKTQPLPKIAAAPPAESEATPAPAAPVSAMPAFLSPATDPTPIPVPVPTPPQVVAAAPPPAKTVSVPILMAPLDPPLIGGPDSGVPSFGLPGMPALPPASGASGVDFTATTPPATGTNSATTAAANGATVPRTEFGIDVGGASTMDMLRAQWSMLKQQHPKLLENLQPIVSVRDLRQRRSVELRLVAGPLADANAAAQLCAALNASGVPSCQPAVYDGQRLAFR